MARKGKDIVCIEESLNDNGFLSKSAKNFERELRVDSVKDMVGKVLLRLFGRKLGTLYVIGHGAGGYQSIGNGASIVYNDKSLVIANGDSKLYGDAEKQLQRLSGRFAFNGKLVLGGCRVAAGSGGLSLLKRISVLLDNVPVEASADKQYPALGMEGVVIRCIGETACTVNVKGVCLDEGNDG